MERLNARRYLAIALLSMLTPCSRLHKATAGDADTPPPAAPAASRPTAPATLPAWSHMAYRDAENRPYVIHAFRIALDADRRVKEYDAKYFPNGFSERDAYERGINTVERVRTINNATIDIREALTKGRSLHFKVIYGKLPSSNWDIASDAVDIVDSFKSPIGIGIAAIKTGKFLASHVGGDPIEADLREPLLTLPSDYRITVDEFAKSYTNTGPAFWKELSAIYKVSPGSSDQEVFSQYPSIKDQMDQFKTLQRLSGLEFELTKLRKELADLPSGSEKETVGAVRLRSAIGRLQRDITGSIERAFGPPQAAAPGQRMLNLSSGFNLAARLVSFIDPKASEMLSTLGSAAVLVMQMQQAGNAPKLNLSFDLVSLGLNLVSMMIGGKSMEQKILEAIADVHQSVIDMHNAMNEQFTGVRRSLEDIAASISLLHRRLGDISSHLTSLAVEVDSSLYSLRRMHLVLEDLNKDLRTIQVNSVRDQLNPGEQTIHNLLDGAPASKALSSSALADLSALRRPLLNFSAFGTCDDRLTGEVWLDRLRVRAADERNLALYKVLDDRGWSSVPAVLFWAIEHVLESATDGEAIRNYLQERIGQDRASFVRSSYGSIVNDSEFLRAVTLIDKLASRPETALQVDRTEVERLLTLAVANQGVRRSLFEQSIFTAALANYEAECHNVEAELDRFAGQAAWSTTSTTGERPILPGALDPTISPPDAEHSRPPRGTAEAGRKVVEGWSEIAPDSSGTITSASNALTAWVDGAMHPHTRWPRLDWRGYQYPADPKLALAIGAGRISPRFEIAWSMAQLSETDKLTALRDRYELTPLDIAPSVTIRLPLDGLTPLRTEARLYYFNNLYDDEVRRRPGNNPNNPYVVVHLYEHLFRVGFEFGFLAPVVADARETVQENRFSVGYYPPIKYRAAWWIDPIPPGQPNETPPIKPIANLPGKETVANFLRQYDGVSGYDEGVIGTMCDHWRAYHRQDAERVAAWIYDVLRRLEYLHPALAGDQRELKIQGINLSVVASIHQSALDRADAAERATDLVTKARLRAEARELYGQCIKEFELVHLVPWSEERPREQRGGPYGEYAEEPVAVDLRERVLADDGVPMIPRLSVRELPSGGTRTAPDYETLDKHESHRFTKYGFRPLLYGNLDRNFVVDLDPSSPDVAQFYVFESPKVVMPDGTLTSESTDYEELLAERNARVLNRVGELLDQRYTIPKLMDHLCQLEGARRLVEMLLSSLAGNLPDTAELRSSRAPMSVLLGEYGVLSEVALGRMRGATFAETRDRIAASFKEGIEQFRGALSRAHGDLAAGAPGRGSKELEAAIVTLRRILDRK